MVQNEPFSVHNQPDFERVYDDDQMIEVRRGDLQALLDLATGSMDFGSGFWDEEQVEIARKTAALLDIDMMLVTPSNFTYQYGCKAKGQHQWDAVAWTASAGHNIRWYCRRCHHTSASVDKPTGLLPDDDPQPNR
jgi:hypothetical protein